MRVLGLRVASMERGPTDMLPYLPAFRSMFSSLARPADDVHLEVEDIPVSDVECVTDTIGKVNGPAWYMMVEKGTCCPHGLAYEASVTPALEQKRIAEQELFQRSPSWTKSTWDETDWSRVKELKVQEVLNERSKLATIAQKAQCLQCPNFLKHVKTRPGLIGRC